MDQFLNFFLERPFLFVYASLVAAALIRYSRYYDTPLRFFPVLLMYTLLTEILGFLVRDDQEWSLVLREFYLNNNWLIYNIYAIVFFLYFCYVYHCYIRSDRARQWIRIGTGAYVAVSLINAFLQDFVTESQVYSYVLGGLMMVAFSGYYLYQVLRTREQTRMVHYNLLFWVSLGIAIFYAGYTPIKYIRFRIADYQVSPIDWIPSAHLVLTYILYGCFLTGFLLMRRMKRPRRAG